MVLIEKGDISNKNSSTWVQWIQLSYLYQNKVELCEAVQGQSLWRLSFLVFLLFCPVCCLAAKFSPSFPLHQVQLSHTRHVKQTWLQTISNSALCSRSKWTNVKQLGDAIITKCKLSNWFQSRSGETIGTACRLISLVLRCHASVRDIFRDFRFETVPTVFRLALNSSIYSNCIL